MTISYIRGRGALSLDGGGRWRRGCGEGTTSAWGGKLRGFVPRCTLKGLGKVQERVKFLIQNASLFSYCYACFLEGFRVNVVK